jgi:hypothetical protein
MYILSTIFTEIHEHTFWTLLSFFSIDAIVYGKLIVDRRAEQSFDFVLQTDQQMQFIAYDIWWNVSWHFVL